MLICPVWNGLALAQHLGDLFNNLVWFFQMQTDKMRTKERRRRRAERRMKVGRPVVSEGRSGWWLYGSIKTSLGLLDF